MTSKRIDAMIALVALTTLLMLVSQRFDAVQAAGAPPTVTLASQPLEVTIGTNQREVMLWEPIVIAYSVRNTGSTPVLFFDGDFLVTKVVGPVGARYGLPLLLRDTPRKPLTGHDIPRKSDYVEILSGQSFETRIGYRMGEGGPLVRTDWGTQVEFRYEVRRTAGDNYYLDGKTRVPVQAWTGELQSNTVTIKLIPGYYLMPKERAIEQAEAFIRANGFTNQPASVSPDQIWLEPNESRRDAEKILQKRRGLLGENAIAVKKTVDTHNMSGWMVLFGYQAPQHQQDSGRVVFVEGRIGSIDLTSSEVDFEAFLREPGAGGEKGFLTQAGAIRLAEYFIRGNGYTDQGDVFPADRITLESIESYNTLEAILASRKGTLESVACLAKYADETATWLVTFRYTNSRDPSHGRAVTMGSHGDNIKMNHQDVILKDGPCAALPTSTPLSRQSRIGRGAGERRGQHSRQYSAPIGSDRREIQPPFGRKPGRRVPAWLSGDGLL